MTRNPRLACAYSHAGIVPSSARKTYCILSPPVLPRFLALPAEWTAIMRCAMAAPEKVSIFCFAASYAVALALELAHLLSPRPILRYLGLGFGMAGLCAQLIYVFVQSLSLGSPAGSLLFLA